MAPGDNVGCYLHQLPELGGGVRRVWWSGAVVAAVGTLLPTVEAERLFELADVSVVIALEDTPELPATYTVLRVDADGRLLGAPEVGDDEWRAAAEFAVSCASRPTTSGRDLHVGHHRSPEGHRAQPLRHRRGHATRRHGLHAQPATTGRSPRRPHLPPSVIFNPFGHMAGYPPAWAFRMWIGRSVAAGAQVHRGRGPRPCLLALRDGLAATHAHDDPHAGHHRGAARAPRGEVRDLGTAPLPTATRERFDALLGPRSCRPTA